MACMYVIQYFSYRATVINSENSSIKLNDGKQKINRFLKESDYLKSKI